MKLKKLEGMNHEKHRVDLNHVSIEIADEYQLAKANGGVLQKGDEDD
ncbi:hypothetical protein [Bacillus thuringiensis]